MLKNQKKAYQYGLCAVALWSTVATAFKISLAYFEPVQLLLVAAITSTLTLGSIVGQLDSLGWHPHVVKAGSAIGSCCCGSSGEACSP